MQITRISYQTIMNFLEESQKYQEKLLTIEA